MSVQRSVARRVVPEPLRQRIHMAALRARHLPMRVLPAGRASLAEIASLRDAHRGQSCVIIGNGPSARDLDLALIESLPTFCLNRGYLLWEGRSSGPDYYVAVNDLVIEQFHDEIARLTCPLFVPWIHRDSFADSSNAVFVEVRTAQHFIADLRGGVAPCATVTTAALQIAFHLGFSTVLLVGVDHRFGVEGTPHSEIVQKGADPNHFRPDYFGAGTRWNLPDLEQSERGYEHARAAFDAARRRVLNATPGSALDVFERAELGSALARVGPGES